MATVPEIIALHHAAGYSIYPIIHFGAFGPIYLFCENLNSLLVEQLIVKYYINVLLTTLFLSLNRLFTHNYFLTLQTWKPARDLLTNETILDLLEGIKNLTIEANFTDTSPVDAIEVFLANINTATTSGILPLQEKLIIALDTIEQSFRCIANKQHAISIIINDCKSGRDTLKVLHNEADSIYDLNTKTCVEKMIVPHTSLEQLEKIIAATASEKGWHGNCLLNNENLLYRVCSEKQKGYVNPSKIVANVNKTGLSEDMVSHFLTRCPPFKITPKSKADTCYYYCLYKTTQQIATYAGLNENQVLQIIPTCGICSVKESERTEICYLYFCRGMPAGNIETMVEIPLPTVNDVIKNCGQKCIMKETEKQEVCQQLKCEKYDSMTIASSLKFPVASIEELKPQCDTIVKDCLKTFSQADKGIILLLHCSHQFPASDIIKYVELSLLDVESVIKSQVSRLRLNLFYSHKRKSWTYGTWGKTFNL